MKKAWRIALTVVVSVLAAGAVIGCTGLLTGASLSRILNAVFGGKENLVPALEQTFRTLRDDVSGILTAVGF